MSSLWTPGGEHEVPRETSSPPSRSAPSPPGAAPEGDEHEELTEEELQQHLARLRDQLAHTPVEDVVANVAYQLFELGALHLSLTPPQLDQARLAIDALACLAEGLGDRLGPRSNELSDGLAQLRMFFVQVNAAVQSGASPGDGPDPRAGQP